MDEKLSEFRAWLVAQVFIVGADSDVERFEAYSSALAEFDERFGA